MLHLEQQQQQQEQPATTRSVQVTVTRTCSTLQAKVLRTVVESVALLRIRRVAGSKLRHQSGHLATRRSFHRTSSQPNAWIVNQLRLPFTRFSIYHSLPTLPFEINIYNVFQVKHQHLRPLRLKIIKSLCIFVGLLYYSLSCSFHNPEAAGFQSDSSLTFFDVQSLSCE